MSLEWSTKACPPNSIFVMISESTADMGAFAIGRLSKAPMMLWCTRQTALQLADGLTAVMIHFHSALKLAGDRTKEP